ncbi:AraC family transcriptional regulator [Paludisphaera rhizosphaerae]|uniref:AraC family transcriptional regulator n=1 Tax=Paludisphaera rhizosphaerae TaxID=2711216 RepID=UPI0013EA23C2|nr:AraC family transcriptional regulator [Paludisphaera rhizosphaerae]
MRGRGEIRERLALMLGELAECDGIHPMRVEGVSIVRRSDPAVRAPIVYQPKILFVGQGSKQAYLGGETYRYDAYNYLVLAVPMPAECETNATPEEPMLLLAIDVDPTTIGEMLLEMDELAPSPAAVPRGISSTPMTEDLGEAVCRLLECLKSPLDSRMLGRQAVREVVYRVLLGEQGGALRAFANRDDHFARIARVLRYIHSDYANPVGVDDLARKAGMSVAAFHHYFKLVTASSPLQYLKRIRLDQARRLMAHDGLNAGQAARAVGYESASQFSREFKRLFGATPLEEVEQTRTRLAIG